MKNVTILLIFVLSLSLIGCKEDMPPEVDKSIQIGMTKAPNRIHPLIDHTSISREVYQYIFLPLADYNPESGNLEPILISEMPTRRDIVEGEYKGAIAYDIHIREDAVWDNGSPMTGLDYAFTIKAIKIPGVKAAAFRSYIESIEDVIVSEDPRRFTVIIDEDYMSSLESLLSIPLYPSHVYDKEDALSSIEIPELNLESVDDYLNYHPHIKAFVKRFNGNELSRETVEGAGPYKLDSWTENQSIILKRKENHWSKELTEPAFLASPEIIEFVFIPDQVALVSQLKEGNIDLTKYLTADSFEELKNNEVYKEQFRFLNPELYQLYFIGLNNKSEKLSSQKVRRAIAHLIDVPQLMSTLEYNAGTRSVGIIHPRKKYYNKNLKPIDYNIENAIDLLVEEGWVDSDNNGIRDKMIADKRVQLSLDFYITGSELSRNMALIIKENAEKANVKINIKNKNFGRIKKENLLTGKYDMVLQSLQQGPGLDDPYNKWHSDNIKTDGENYYNYKSSIVDGIIKLIQESRDETTRKQYYLKLQELMYQDQPAIFLYNPAQRLVINKKWRGNGISKRPGYMANTFTYVGDMEEG